MMDMDKKSLIGIVLCIVFYLGYSQYLQKKYPDYNKQSQSNVSSSVAPEQSSNNSASIQGDSDQGAVTDVSNTAPQIEKPIQLSEQDLTFSTDTSVYKFNQQSGGISSVQLKNYHQAINSDSKVELAPFSLQLQASSKKETSQEPVQFFGQRNGSQLTFWRMDGQWKISQIYTVPEQGYRFALKIVFENTGTTAMDLVPGLVMTESVRLHATPGLFSSHDPNAIPSTVLIGTSDKTHRFAASSFCEDGKGDSDASGMASKITFLGIDQHYFVKVLTPEFEQVNFAARPISPISTDSCTIMMQAFQPFGSVAPGQKVELKFRSYFGPKQADLMATYDDSLKETIDLGTFAALARPLLAALKIVDNQTHNFGVAILLITLALKICFYPLTRQAAISMNKMKVLQPEMNAIRERYKSDQQTQQRELMAFMVKNKVNPMKGCLPILPQIPVFFAYYQVLQHAIELRHAPFAGWILDLSAKDPYYVTPLLLGAGMFIQQRLTPTTGMDKSQEKILMFMPIVFTLMMLSLPAGMVIYMLTNTVVSILQQQWLNRTLNKA